jgi:hypothetical protein
MAARIAVRWTATGVQVPPIQHRGSAGDDRHAGA